ncbi:uncharacterized protein LOC135144194 [Zophobas morio]|uniref:uncharacterized protein LOC135144194 n=1 Tax=Zophobas morio TaxID=2755281 RepID=UPI0030838002
MDVKDLKEAISAASNAFYKWKNTTPKTRANILKKWHDLIVENKEELARIITSEQGKTLIEAKGEVDYSASYIEWFSEESKRMYGDIIPPGTSNQRLAVIKQPVGVCALLTPWNFPMAMGARKIAPALASGCTVVLKPSQKTPLSSLSLVKLAEVAGTPPGVINVVTTSHTGTYPDIGNELASNPDVRKVSFTGSTQVGKQLLKLAASTVKKVSMELGGNAPFIIFDDADLDMAVKGAIASKFRNSGQTCVSANCIFVQSEVYETFSDRFIKAARDLKAGNGLEENVDFGPLINEQALKKVKAYVDDAVAKGATLALGGKVHSLGGNFFEATVLKYVKANKDLLEKEIFGPVAPLICFQSEEEVLQLVNSTRFGLAAYFYTKDLQRSWRVSEALEFGMIGLNSPSVSTEVAPFGGVKESGVGREGSKYGLDDYTEIKSICIGNISA